MEAKELRIGNVVFVENEKHRPNSKNTDHIVINVGLIDCRVKNTLTGEEFGQYYKFIKPIPITEDWLLKFGFELSLNNWYGGKGIHVNGRVIWLMKVDYDKKYRVHLTDTSICHVKHVHELQNLYFALTGKELQISDN